MRLLLLLPFLLISLARAADPLPGHSSHGEAFNEGPRQAAVLIPGCGKVDFPVTTKNPEAQTFFNQGIGQLHGFWYYEAERSFRQVAAVDPNCAMAYWGMAMANVNNDKRAKGFVAKAVELKAKASEREKLWVTTLETFYKDDKRDKKQRALDFIRDLETIVHEHPTDVEAKAFLAWKIWHSKDVAPISSPQAVDALLDQVFAANPQHPAHHYRIHLWDGSKPIRALKSAAVNGQNAPGIAHMWHMPGHTFSKLKRFDDAAWQQEASTRVDHAYMIGQFVLPDQIHNYAHNEEWLVRTFNDLGRAQDAIRLARSLIAIPRHPGFNTLEKTGTSASYGRTRLLETLQKWELWENLLKLTHQPLLGSVTQENHETARLRAIGVAQFHLDRPAGLAKTIATLETLEKKAKEKPPEKLKPEKPKVEIAQAPAKATIAAAPPDKPPAPSPASVKSATAAPAKPVAASQAKPVAVAPTPAKGTASAQLPAKPAVAAAVAVKSAAPAKKPEAKPNALNAALAELRALRAVLKDEKEAAKLLEAAKDMPKERLARCWLRLDEKQKAETLTKDFSQDLSGLAAKVEVLQACGKTDEAKKAFADVSKAAFAMDGNLPVARRLDAFAKSISISGEWRAAAPKRDDSGTRPKLKSLGPVRWHPPAAPKWEALTMQGAPVSSAALQGKPHILLFYLGSACTHCMEQLEAFAKATPDFTQAGIALTAITPEPMSVASRISERMATKKPPPFPIYCDPSLAAFKAFRAYDDFEKEPLHAAVLIDAEGKLRWIDVSWQPFTNTTFLLEEAQRLLKLAAKRNKAQKTSPTASVSQ